MNDITVQMQGFIESVKATEIYQEYERQKMKLRGYPDLKARIDQFRQYNYEIQNNTAEDQLFDRVDAFQKEYESFREIPMVHDFLAAELAYCRMIQQINDVIYQEFMSDFE